MDANSISEIASALRQTFPTLDESQIAALTLQERANVLTRVAIPAAPPSSLVVIPTVVEIVEKMREKYLRKETRRIRAKIQPDGSINIKDTTTYRTYNTHWKRLVEAHGHLPVTELDQEIISNFAEAAQDCALATHNAANKTRIAKGLTPREFTGGRSHNLALDAVSVIMSHAVSRKFIPDNPVKGVQRAKKTAGKRRGLTYGQVEEIMQVALGGGNDPILDYILLWCLLETAARIGGLIKLQVGDIKMEEGRCVLDLHEKNDSERYQPITKSLHDALIDLSRTRGSIRPTDPVFRYHPDAQGKGNPMQAKRFETLWRRISREIPWVEEKGVSSHWIRHTTVTWIDRAFNSTMAQAFAGHTPANVTAGYSTPTPEELAQAHAALTGTNGLFS